MNTENKIYEIFDLVSDFITDYKTTVNIFEENSSLVFDIIKISESGKYTVKITQPLNNNFDTYGKIFFQQNNNQPVLLAKTATKIPTTKSGFKFLTARILSYQYFKLIQMAKQKQKNILPLQDNTIQILDAILNFKSMQR